MNRLFAQRNNGTTATIVMLVAMCLLTSRVAEAAESSWISIPKTDDPLFADLTIPANAASSGMWSPVFPWPMNGLHSMVLPTGKVLTFGSSADGVNQESRLLDVWDPAVGFSANSHKSTYDAERMNSFCSTSSYLPNGQLMISGGNASRNSGLFFPADGTFTPSSLQMASDRWYATNVNLPSGGTVILGGMVPYRENMVNDPVGAINGGLASMTPELFNPTTGWQSLFGATSRDAFGPDYLRLSYPRAWVAPSGKVFGISSETMWYLDTSGNGTITIAGKFKTPADLTTRPNVGATNTAVMFAPGRILQVGGNGYFNGDGYPASSSATVIDINDVNPVLTEQPPMTYPRRYPNSIVLSDGKVVITGGTKVGNNGGADAVYPVEIWSPATSTWSGGASASHIRVYHSMTALLLNGTILSTGGGTPGPVTNLNGEIYYPPYLFQNVSGTSQLAPRPIIDAISSLTYANAGTLQLDMADSATISQLVLVGLSSGTHSFNTTQRRIPLAFSQVGVQLTASVPNANLVPPGYYQVVALNAAGVPSRGVIIGVGQIAKPNMPVTLAIGTDVTLSPLNITGQAIGIDANNLAISQPLSTSPSTQELAATTFTVRRGNAAPNCVSFEFKAKPGQFLRHSGYRLQISPGDGSALFNDDSTFCPEVGLSSLGGVTLRSRNYPSNMIRNRNGQIWLDASDGTLAFTDSASFIVKPSITTVQLPAISAPITTSGSTVNYAPTIAVAGAQFSWNFGDGSAATAFSTSTATSHLYAQSGTYLVTLTVRFIDGTVQTKTFVQAVANPITLTVPTASSSVALEKTAAGTRLWTVNPDNNSVSVLSTTDNTLIVEIPVGGSPRSLAVSPNGSIWVTNKDSSSLSIIDPSTLAIKQSIALPRASRPHGLAFSPDGTAAYVVLEATGQLLKLNPTTGAQIAALAVGANARHVSVDASGSRLLVSRFITPPLPGENTAAVNTTTSGGEVLVINASNLTLTTTVKLKHSDKADTSIQGSGIPNYLGAPVISPDGKSVWVPSKQDNVKRGTLRNGLNLDFQNTVRAISSRIDLATLAEDYPSRIDHDNSSVASASSYDSTGAYLFVALETSRQVEVVNALGGTSLYRIEVGLAPQGLTVSPDGMRLYVQNFMDRTVSVVDISPLTKNGEFRANLVATVKSTNTEKLSATVLRGKQLFYDARDARLARDSYMSCATCHNDAGHDGRVWDITGLGEGLRNTIPLKGRAGMKHGFLHWTANFDEVQDFEKQIRSLAGGLGLMTDAQYNAGTRNQPLGDKKAGISADLDALAAYLTSLNRFDNSPFRSADASLTPAAVAGKTVFQNKQCASYHTGSGFTNSTDTGTLKNIGTIKSSSGTRLGGTLTGIDVPTLRDAWSSAPYLHDGSAQTLAAAVQAHLGNTIAGTDLDNVAAYLQQIGQEEIGFLGRWSFNEGRGKTTADSSGAERPLTLTHAAWTAGKFGQALQFNGKNAAASAKLPILDTASSFSVSAWVRLDALSGWGTMVNQDGVTVSGFWLQYSQALGNKFSLSMHDSDSTTSVAYRAVSTTVPVTGQWYHVVGVRDKTAGTMKLYVNGRLEATISYTGGWKATGVLSVGRGKWGVANDWFAGGIDEVSVFDSSLTDAEVAQLYTQGGGM
jgi:YVTN family beta-propeller protein